MLSISGGASFAADDLAKRFVAPPEETRPRCYWYWMDGNISREGITRDLEAMKRVGIGEAYIGVIHGQSGGAPKAGLKALSDPWWGLIEHAVREGGRLGVDIGFFNSPGWSQSGGPWIKPGQAMRYIAFSETRLHGPQRFEGKLATPGGDFQDVAVLAFPVPAGEDVVAPVASRSPKSIDFKMDEPFTARSLLVQPLKAVNVQAELQASDDGKTYWTIRRFGIDRHNLQVNVGPVPLAPVGVSFPATTARFFRLNFSGACELGDIRLSSAARLERFMEKQLVKMFQNPLPPFDYYTWPRQAEPESKDLAISPGTVLNLSKQLGADGTLRWDVPEGDWIVVRAGMLPTGTENSPAPPEATGLEVDKMDRAALAAHFDAYVGKLLARIPAADRKALKHIVADSYEMGPENWTDGFAQDFQKRYGYDPLPFLPAMSGRIVGSAGQSDRFLWDLRRFVADRIARDYVGGLRDLCHKHGLKMWLENYGHWGFPAEFLQYGGACDEVSGEFWVSSDLGGVELRDAASAAHIYGKTQVWAEAFTGGPSFTNTPRELKARGDWALCEGVNQFVLHVYIHQPDDKKPGINAWFGTEFNRNNTWFEQSKPWIDYLRRCSVMLQAGKHVADVAYFIGEDTPKMAGSVKPQLPPGYDYDFINAEVIEKSLTVKNGRFVLPDGMSYKLLVLPESATMRPEVLKKIGQLAADGGAVLGSPPERSPSLENFPACDREVKASADALWGKGLVLTGKDLAPVLQKLNVQPDIVCPKNILWKHRQDGERDIYFLSNQKAESRTETVSFRVNDRAPALWWPDSGKIEPVPYTVADGRTTLTLPFDPAGSVFVVFGGNPAVAGNAGAPLPDEPSKAKIVIQKAIYGVLNDPQRVRDVTEKVRVLADTGTTSFSVGDLATGDDPAYGVVKTLKVDYTADGKPLTATGQDTDTMALNSAAAPGTEITGPWTVEFPAQKTTFEKLISWTDHADPAIKYYSGAATYNSTFQIPAPGTKDATFLDLGRVEALATVTLNGHTFPTLWKYPYRLDISSAIKRGENNLSVTVVNTWNNRLVGDAAQPPEKRGTFVSKSTKKPDSPLQPSGLIGPVRLLGNRP